MPISRHYTIIETLSENIHTTVYRAKRIKDGSSVIIKMLKSSYKDENRVFPFVNEHHILSLLRSKKVAKIIDSINTPSERIYVFEDIGGKTLHESLLMENFTIAEALYIAIELSEIVAYLYNKNVIHTDINPKNILYNPETRRLRLIDFGYAIMQNHAKNIFYLPSDRSDNLFYLAPEQTGKTVQKVDHRSDLYGLGMTFYHLFSGELPFSGSERHDLIHKQLAMELPSLNTTRKSIPNVISAIVHKLIEKKPEHRYQTIKALLFDLEKCQKELSETGKIADFEIATMDRPVIRIGEELFGRDKELGVLNECVAKALSPSSTRLLISGVSGIGKTRLAVEYIDQLQSLGVHVIQSKFDQFLSTTPYSVFNDIFEQLRILWLSQNERIKFALDENSSEVLRQIFPQFREMLPGERKKQSSSLYDFHRQLMYAVNEFFGQSISKDFSILLFIDDLQWADQSSIELLEHLLSFHQTPYLHFIGNFREVEIESNPFALNMVHRLESFKENKAVILSLQPLGENKIYEMITTLLQDDGKEIRDLASILEKKTGGNPFYFKAFFEHLLKKEIIAYVRGRWKFSIEEVVDITVNINVADLIRDKFNRLTLNEQIYLQYLTLLGDSGSLKETFDAMTSFKQLNIHIKHLEKEGFIEIINRKYKFVHDQMQHYVYLTIDNALKQKIHCQIGRYLDQKGIKEKRDIISIVAHLNKGYSVHKFPKKLYAMNLESLEIMLKRNAYAQALREIRWMIKHQFDTRLIQCHPGLEWRFRALMGRTFYLNGEFADAADQIGRLRTAAQTYEQKQEFFHLYKDLCVTEGQGYISLFEYVVELFEEFGLTIPKPSALEQSLIQLEEKITSHAKYSNLEALSSMKALSNKEHKRVMDLLVEAWEVAYYLSDVKLMRWMCLTIIDYSLRYGQSSASAFGYVLYGAWLVSQQEYKKGYEFGELALKINHRFNNAVMLPKIHNFVANFISPYRKKYGENIPLYQKSIAQAEINGDIVFGTWANFLMHLSRYFSGTSLDDLASDMVHRSAFILNSGDQKMIKIFMFLSHTVHSLQDLHAEPFEDEESMVFEWEREKFYPGLAWYAVLKAQNAFLNGAFESGLRILERHVHSEMNEVIMFPKIRLHFIRALLLLGIDIPLSETQKEILDGDIAFFDAVGTMSPKEFRTVTTLLQIEREKHCKGVWKVSEAYDKILAKTKRDKNYFYFSIAGLCASRFWKKLGYADMSRFYQNEAVLALNQWGAYAFAERLKKEQQNDTLPVKTDTVDNFNYQTIINAFSALTKTIDKTKLIQTLLHFIGQHATASRAVLIFKEREQYSVYATLDFKSNESHIGPHLLDESVSVPKTMIRYALNTAETIISDESCKTGKFRNDEYFRTHSMASCVVLPVILEGIPSGALYLENQEIATPLSPESMKILELLMTHAAIIFNNAVLFEEIRQTENELNKAQVISKVGSWKFNSQTQKITWSAETYRIFELEPFSIEVDHEWLIDHMGLEDRSRIQEAVEKTLNEQKPYDVVHSIITGKGNEKIVHQRAESFWDGEVQMMSGTIQDITESKRAEDIIQQYTQVIYQSPFSIIITDISGKIEYVNPECLKMTGFFEHELVGKRMNIFRSGIHSQNFYAGLWNTISKEKKLWQGTLVNRIKDGTFIDCASTIFPILDHDRAISHFVTIQENVTERNVKEKLFVMQTRQAQMGEMLSMIAHQWRQPLAVIGTLLNKERVNLVLHEPNVEELMQNFDDIEAQIQHLSRTISDFRDFFKPDKEETTTKNSQIVLKAASLLEHMLKQKNIVLVQEHEHDEEYKTYEHEMVQVVLNLIKNAQDAFEEKNILERKIIVKTSQYRGNSIISVEDNAGGVNPNVHDTLFMPYVSTKNEQNGTGLGLYMSKTIVEDHCRGKLTFHNTDNGVVFTIKLPLKGEND